MKQREAMMRQIDMARNSTALGVIMAALACWLAGTAPVRAADVTYERLLNPEPQNWLMHHHDFNAQRYSPLDQINKSNAKNLKLAFAVALGGKTVADSLEAPPLPSSGRWTPALPTRTAIAARRCGVISSCLSPAMRAASSRPTRRPARSS